MVIGSHYREVRERIIDHMRNVLDPVYVSDYLRSTNMDQDGIWGTDDEIRTLAHLNSFLQDSNCILIIQLVIIIIRSGRYTSNSVIFVCARCYIPELVTSTCL